MNRKFSSVVKNFSNKFLVLALLLNIIAPPVIHAGEPPSEQQSEEKTYSRTGAAQLRFQAAKVNIQEAQAPVAEEPPVFTCDTDSPTSYHYEVCCGFCGEYEYCGTRSCPTCADYGLNGTFPDCYSGPGGGGGGGGTNVPAGTSVTAQCHNIATTVTGNFSKVGNQKESFNGLYFDDSDLENNPVSESNPIIIFRRQVIVKEAPGKWEAMKIYVDKNGELQVETGELKSFIPSKSERDKALKDNNDQGRYDSWKNKCLIKTYDLPEGMTYEQGMALIANGDLGVNFGVNGANLAPNQNNMEIGPGHNYGHTKQDMIINGIFIPKGSIIVGFANYNNNDFESPDRIKDFSKFQFYHPEHNTLLGTFSSKEVFNHSFTVDENGNKDSKIKFGKLSNFKNNQNPFFSFDYNADHGQGFGLDLDGQSSVDEDGNMTISNEVFNFSSFLRNARRIWRKGKTFAGSQARKSGYLMKEWFGINSSNIDIDTMDANKIRALMGLPLTHHDETQKLKEDDLLMKTLKFANVAEKRVKKLIEIVDSRVDNFTSNNKKYQNASNKKKNQMLRKRKKKFRQQARRAINKNRSGEYSDITRKAIKKTKKQVRRSATRLRRYSRSKKAKRRGRKR